MKKRVKGLIAILMALLLVNQLIPDAVLYAVAEEISVTSNTTQDISTDASGDTYTIYGSGGVVNVLSGGSIGTVNVLSPDNSSISTVLNVNAGGSVGTVSSSAGSTVTTAGSISNITSNGNLTLSGGNIGTLNVTGGSATVNGTIQVDTANIDVALAGSGSLTIASELTYNAASEGTASLNVSNSTTISAQTGISVIYNGYAYYVPANTVNQTIDDMYGYSVSASSLSFGSQTAGYSQVASKTFTVINTKTCEIDIYLANKGANYNVSATVNSASVSVDEFSLAAGESATITVYPKTGLAAGTYNESLEFNILGETNTVSLDFTVKAKAKGTGTATMEDYYYGAKTANPVVSSDTNGVGNKTVQFKLYNAADSTYTSVVPTEVGDYTMRVVFAETATYSAVTVTDNFSVIYLPIPYNPYSIYGTKGQNNFYTTTVRLVPAEGYLVATELNGEYKEELYYNSSTYSEEIYFMDIETGAKTDALLISNMLIDTYVPAIADVEDGETYYVDDMDVWVRDANLKTVTVNEEDATLLGNSALLQLSSNGGITEYNIKAVDYAGHETTMTFTLASEWTKTGVIPSGQKVRLDSGVAYTLGEGSWQVSGDDTTYTGGSSFYVDGQVDYTFTQQ